MPDKESLGVLTINCNIIDTLHKECKSIIRWKMINNTQETDKLKRCSINTDGNLNSNSRDQPMVIYSNNSRINYFILGPQQEANNRTSAESTHQVSIEFKDVLISSGSFNSTLLLQRKLDRKRL